MKSRSNRSRASCSESGGAPSGSAAATFQELQIGERNDVSRDHDHQPFDHVAQLAHVARPAVAAETRRGAGIEMLGPAPVLTRELRHEMLRKEWNVRVAIPQRRHENRNDVQAEIEILAKAARPDLRG